MTITLYTRDGGLVTKIDIPAMQPPPDGIVWGSRFFVRGVSSGDFNSGPNYYEGLLWHTSTRSLEGVEL